MSDISESDVTTTLGREWYKVLSDNCELPWDEVVPHDAYDVFSEVLGVDVVKKIVWDDISDTYEEIASRANDFYEIDCVTKEMIKSVVEELKWHWNNAE